MPALFDPRDEGTALLSQPVDLQPNPRCSPQEFARGDRENLGMPVQKELLDISCVSWWAAEARTAGGFVVPIVPYNATFACSSAVLFCGPVVDKANWPVHPIDIRTATMTPLEVSCFFGSGCFVGCMDAGHWHFVGRWRLAVCRACEARSRSRGEICRRSCCHDPAAIEAHSRRSREERCRGAGLSRSSRRVFGTRGRPGRQPTQASLESRGASFRPAKGSTLAIILPTPGT